MSDRDVDAGVLLLLRGQVEERLVREIAAEDGLTVTRRCGDVSELLAAALAGLGSVAVVDSEFGVDRTVIERLRGQGTRVLVCCAEQQVRRYDSLGALGLAWGVAMIPAILSLANSTETGERVIDALGGEGLGPPAPAVPGNADEAAAPEETGPVETTVPARVLVVTGAPGAPGRSTLAINIADDLAARGAATTLIDADLWGGSLAQMLGMLADTAGLSAAVRAADQGTLDVSVLGRLAPQVRPGLRLLPGLARASRWREVSAVNVEVVLQAAKRGAAWVVVEAPVLVPEEEPAFGFGPGRNEVAESLLAAADEILVVGAAEPVGIGRLVQTLLDLDDVPRTARRHAVVNRIRSSAAGPRAASSVQEALARFADVHDPVLIPDDRPMCDRSLLSGTTWSETAGRSAALKAVREFTQRLVAAGEPAPVTRGRRRSRSVRLVGRRRRTPAH